MLKYLRGLRARTFGYLFLLGLVAALAGYGMSSALLQRSLHDYEQRHIQAQLQQLWLTFESRRQTLSSHSQDYALWDETYDFMLSGDPAYLRRNFTAGVLANLAADQVLFIQADGRLLTGLDGRGPTPRRLDSGAWRALAPLVARYLPHLSAQKATLYGWHNGEPLLLAFHPVRNTDADRPSRGWLLFVQHLDATRQQRIASLVKLPFTLAEHPPSPPGATLLQASRRLGERPGEAEVHLSITRPPLLAKQLADARWLLLGNSALVLLVSLLVAAVLFERLILRRLSLFANLADRRRQDHGMAVHFPVRGDDELDRLARSLNALMGEVSQVEQHLHHEIRRDSLTRLGNRTFLHEQMQLYRQLVAQNPELELALLLIDLDGFKLINDSLGHGVGDQALTIIGERIRHAARGTDITVRLGGDEFAVLCLQSVQERGAERLASRILEQVALPLDKLPVQVTISCSIGIAYSQQGALAADELISHADLAMYEAKHRGKGRICRYSERMQVQVNQRMRIEQQLRSAIAAGQLEVWFQPIVRQPGGEIVMVEALARWPTAEGYCPPDQFIPVAEEAGLIGALGAWVAQAAISALPRLRRQCPGLHLNINLSVLQLLEEDLVGRLTAMLDQTGLPRQALHLELTESLFAHDNGVMQRRVLELANAGFELHLDDFGTGYSSLGRLQSLPMSALKLDRCFVQQLEAEDDERMVRSILSLGSQLGMQVIAEGVETLAQRERLLALGCTLMQGFLFARPMPEAALTAWLAQQAGVTRPEPLPALGPQPQPQPEG